MKIISDIYNGKINPIANQMPQDSEYHKFLQEVCTLEGELENVLPNEGKKIFQEYQTAQGKMIYTSSEQRFTEGFLLGARLMLEILESDIKIEPTTK